MDEPDESPRAGQADDSKAAKEAAKVAKKAAKSAAKAAKKGAPGPATPASSPVLSPASPPRDVEQPAATPPDGMSPAERSALAAERAVALQRRRVIISAIGVVLALVTALITWLSFRASSERAPKPGQGTIEPRPADPQQPVATTQEEGQ